MSLQPVHETPVLQTRLQPWPTPHLGVYFLVFLLSPQTISLAGSQHLSWDTEAVQRMRCVDCVFLLWEEEGQGRMMAVQLGEWRWLLLLLLDG